MNARAGIKEGLVNAFKTIDGTGTFTSNLFTNVVGKLIYWDEVPDYPYVCVTVKRETRQYLPGNFKWGFLEVPIWVYIKGDDSEQVIENVFTDIETVVDANRELEYETGKFTEDMSILSFTTDEGLMEPLRIGEILLQVRYGVSI